MCEKRANRRILFSLLLFIISIAGFSQPVVVTQPQDTSVCVESSAGFNIIAVNTSAYQWQEHDGIGWYNITESITYAEGENTPNLTIIDANLALNGNQYRCVVSDMSGLRDTSQAALLGVFEPPFITLDPSNERVCKNEIAYFSVEALNGTLFQWQEFNGTGWLNLTDDSFYSGTHTADLGVYTVLGMNSYSYRCIIKNVSCPDTSLTASLTVDQTPIIYAVTGGGSFCDGQSGVEVGLDGSENGISYNLMLDDVQTGQVKEGTGSAISFGEQSIQGIYTITGYNQYTSCISDMADYAEVVQNPLPLNFTVMGGGDVCAGDQMPEIYLLGSETGVEYVLYHNSSSTGQILTGTGFGINFGSQDLPGYYTIIATNILTGCENQMSGVVEINVMDLPIANAGINQIIAQGSNTTLSGSATGGSGNYLWNWTPVVLCQTPNVPNTQTVPLNSTTLFKLNVTDNQSQCQSENDTVVVFVTGDQFAVNIIASSQSICEGNSVMLQAMPSGGTGNYTYSWYSDPPGFTSNQANPVVYPTVTTTYFVNVSDGVNVANASVVISVLSVPSSFNIIGGGDYCQGGVGVEVGLDDSENGVIYTLYRFPDNEIISITGNGNAISFGNQLIAGEYFVVANPNGSCPIQMNGSITVVVNQIPVANAGLDKTVANGGQVVINGSAVGGSGNYIYNWQPESMLINPDASEPLTIAMQSTTLFTLDVVDALTGCSGTNDQCVVFVTGGNLNLLVTSSSNAICEGQQVQLFALISGGSGSYSYLWTESPGNNTYNIYNPVVSPEETTVYTVTVSDGISMLTDSIIINVNQAPQKYNITGGGLYCNNGEGSEIILSGSELNCEYELINQVGSTGLTFPGTGNSISFGNQYYEGDYWIVATNNTNFCSSTMNDTVNVEIAELPQSFAGVDQYITVGTLTQLFGEATSGSGYYGFNWFPDYLLENNQVQNPYTVILDHSEMFRMFVSDISTGCLSDEDTVVVYVTGTDLVVDATADPEYSCSGSPVNLSVIPSGGTGNYNFSWTSDPSGFSSNNQFPVDYPEINTAYFVCVSDGDTTVYDTVFVNVTDSPQVYTVQGGGSFCSGNEGVNITLSGSQTGVDYTLIRDSYFTFLTLPGTGNSIDFGMVDVSGTYFVIAVDNDSGCDMQMSGSAIIVKNDLPIADAGINMITESGTSVTLNGSASSHSGDIDFLWSPSDKLLNPTDPDATTVPLNETSLFSLQVTDNQTSCVSEKDNVIVFISGGELSVDVIFDKNQICPGENVNIYALPTGGTGVYSYCWRSEPEGLTATSQFIIVSPSVETKYMVTVTDGTETATDSATITTFPLPQKFTLLGGGSYCEGGIGKDISLEDSENSVIYSLYRNTNSTGYYVLGTGSQIDFGTFLTEGYYSVTAVNEYGCSNLMNNVVSINTTPLPEKFTVYGGGTYCENDPSLGILLESSQTDVDYELVKDAVSTGITKEGTGLPLSFGNFSGSGYYSIEAYNRETGCSNTMNGVAALIINDAPDIAVSGGNQVCEGDTLLLSATGAMTYEWNTYPPAYTASIKVSPVVDTYYSVTGYNSNGCSNISEHEVVVNFSPSITLYNDESSETLICNPDNLANYAFEMNGNIFQNGTSASWYYGNAGLLSDTIYVIATNDEGCSDTQSEFVEVGNNPNAFSPNGDGVNDIFMKGYDIKLFSSWGNELFSGDEGWDGKYNGELVPPGTYYYVHQVYSTNGQLLKTVKGSVTVVIE